MSDTRSAGLKAFEDLQASLKDAREAFAGLAAEQKRQCQTITETAEKASRIAVEASEAFSASKPRLMLWTALCAALLVSGGWLAAYWVGQHNGWAAGQVAGKQEALAANAAASWANTPSGKLAHGLDEEGLLQPLALCRLPGYETKYDAKAKRTYCYPTENASGWAVEQ